MLDIIVRNYGIYINLKFFDFFFFSFNIQSFVKNVIIIIVKQIRLFFLKNVYRSSCLTHVTNQDFYATIRSYNDIRKAIDSLCQGESGKIYGIHECML